MTLEDQIRRMGDARAADVTTPPWRDHLDSGGRRWPLLVAAAAVVALVVGLAFAVLPSDDDDTEVSGDGADESVGRWVPPDGVHEIAYGASPIAAVFTVPGQQVALVTTPDDATSARDDDWTWISVGPPPLIFSLAEDGDPGPRDGYLEFGLDGGRVLISSQRLTAADLSGAEAALREADGDITAIASTIASLYPDLEVVYAGPASSTPTQVSSEPEMNGEVVWWIGEPDPARYMATYRWLLRADGNAVGELFAMEDDALLNQDFAAYPGEPPPRAVTEEEWLAIVDRLLGEDPEVSSAPSGDPAGDLAGLGPASAHAVLRADGSWTVELRFPEPVAFDPPFGFAFAIGPSVTLSFGVFEGTATNVLVLDATLAEAEATRYAELIDAFVADPPSTTTADPYPTNGPPQQTGVCAANPIPSDDVLDLATHIAFDRSPLDLDQDGVDDEMLVYDEDGTWFLVARLQSGWTNRVDLDGPDQIPMLVSSSEGLPAAADLDGDGALEFFVGGFGETADRSAVMTLRGCRLQHVTFADSGQPAYVLHGGQSLGCNPTGCFTRVTCDTGHLLVEFLAPVEGGLDREPSEVELEWAETNYTLRDAELVESDRSGTRFSAADMSSLPDRPTEATTGVIDCTP